MCFYLFFSPLFPIENSGLCLLTLALLFFLFLVSPFSKATRYFEKKRHPPVRFNWGCITNTFFLKVTKKERKTQYTLP